MKKSLKMRLAVFLSILMVLPAVITILPTAATDVSASSSKPFLSWCWGDDDTYSTIQIEKGQSFYIGDYGHIYISQPSGLPVFGSFSMFQCSYSSSKKSVATVNRKGLVSTKKTGTTTLTLKYSGQKLTVKLQVVAAGSFKKPGSFSRQKKDAASLAKKTPSRITTKNGFSLIKQLRKYEKAIDERATDSLYIDSWGFLRENDQRTNKLILPDSSRTLTLNLMMMNYGIENSPTSTTSAKVMKIRSISATPDKVTIKIKKKLDASQILAVRILNSTGENLNLSGTSTAYLSMMLYDKKDSSSMYYCKALIKKGSDTLTLIPYQYNNPTIKARLKKGHSYYLEYSRTGWTKGKTVKVK